MHDRVVGQVEELRPDRTHDQVAVAVRPPRRPGPALEERVTGEDAAEVVDVEADRAGRVPGGVEHGHRGATDRQGHPVREVHVPQLGPLLVTTVGELPQRPVVGVQQDRRTGRDAQRRRHAYVVVVRVRADDGLHRPAADDPQDRVDVVRGVDDDALLVVTDHPDVVVDVVGLAVEAEGPRDDGVVDAGAHRITTERSTPPECIVSKAASTSSRPISSLTKASRSSRPCW